MKWQGLRIHIVILSILAGLAFFTVGQMAYQKYGYHEPLHASLKENEYIDSYQLSNEGGIVRLIVRFKYGEDLFKAYKHTHEELSRILGKRTFLIILDDNRDYILEELWYNCQFAVYQGALLGNFQEMANTVKMEATNYGVDARVYVDHENIYIRLRHNGNTLDEVVPLDSPGTRSKHNPATGGGS